MITIITLICFTAVSNSNPCNVPTSLDINWLMSTTTKVTLILDKFHDEISKFIDLFKKTHNVRDIPQHFSLDQCPSTDEHTSSTCNNAIYSQYLIAFKQETDRITPSMTLLRQRIDRRIRTLIKNYRIYPIQGVTAPTFEGILDGLEVNLQNRSEHTPFTLFKTQNQRILTDTNSLTETTYNLNIQLAKQLTLSVIQKTRFIGLSLPTGLATIIIDTDDLLHRLLDSANRMITVASQTHPSITILGHITDQELTQLQQYCIDTDQLPARGFSIPLSDIMATAHMSRNNGKLSIKFSAGSNLDIISHASQLLHSFSNTSTDNTTSNLFFGLLTKHELIAVSTTTFSAFMIIAFTLIYRCYRRYRLTSHPTRVELKFALTRVEDPNLETLESDDQPLRTFKIE